MAKKKGAENAKLDKDLQKAESAVKAAETKLASIDFDEKKTVKLADRLQAEEKEAQHWQERVQKLQACITIQAFRPRHCTSSSGTLSAS